jgi:hypothetical protein
MSDRTAAPAGSFGFEVPVDGIGVVIERDPVILVGSWSVEHPNP